MWSKSNWCERIILTSFITLLSLLCYNIFIEKVFCNYYLFLSIGITTVLTIWIACRDIRYLLEQNVPLKTDDKNILDGYHHFNFLGAFIFVLKRFLPERESCVWNDTKRRSLSIDVLSDVGVIGDVIERRCVWEWYSQYVSKEEAFPLACKQLLDQMVTKVFLASYNVDTINFYTDILGIILKHCKEYKKSKRRQAKIGDGRIEEYYRNSHPTSPQRNSLPCIKGRSTQGHCLLLVRSFLKELLPWELWGTPQSLLLASILAKRLDTFINMSLSNPAWLKYRIMKIVNSELCNQFVNTNEKTTADSENKNHKGENQGTVDKADGDCSSTTTETEPLSDAIAKSVVSETTVEDVNKPTIETALSNMISSSTAPILQRAEIDDNSVILLPDKTLPKLCSQPINITNSPLKKVSNSNEVKIYDKVLEERDGIKTWNNNNDLECVSLGQDLLASLDGEVETRFGRLWEADGVDGTENWSPNPPSTGSSTKMPHSLWFGEDDNMDVESAEESPPKHSTNNCGNQTWNEAPAAHHNMDEAAGVMEGIFDFGMAGLRKGLRLTGIQENQMDKSIPTSIKLSEGVSTLTSSIGNVLSRKNSHSEPEHNGKLDFKGVESWSNNKSSNNIPLVKQQRISSQDSACFGNPLPKEMAPLREGEHEKDSFSDPLMTIRTDSPEYEYEEPADFASTIAKLRHLLQQKTTDVTPKTQDDSNIPDAVSVLNPIAISKPTSSTQPTNSPVHKIASTNQNIVPTASKSEEIVSSPSADSDCGFTILSQNSSELVEAEEALNHKIEQLSSSNVPQANTNNMQRLDKLFTRTVTGVFNTIKTAVGGDSLSEGVSGLLDTTQSGQDKPTLVRPHQHKDDWIFVEGEMEVCQVVGKLLMERRGFCVVDSEVEAGQDILEVLSGTPHTPISPEVNHDLEAEAEDCEMVLGCPLYQMVMEVGSVVVGGVLLKDAAVKCITVIIAEIVESFLQKKANELNSWLGRVIVECFRDLSKDEVQTADGSKTSATESSKQPTFDNQQICVEILKKIPDAVFSLLGEEEIREAVSMLLTSLDSPTINRDLTFNLLDVCASHFVRACSVQCGGTPPPSA